MKKKIKNKKPKPKYILYIERRNKYQFVGFVEINELVQFARLIQKNKPNLTTTTFEWNELCPECRNSIRFIIDGFDLFEVNAKLSNCYKPKKKIRKNES